MLRSLQTLALAALLLTGIAYAQQPGQQGPQQGPKAPKQLPPPEPPRGTDWSDWGSSSNNANIAYRYRMLHSGKSCFFEFKDQAQGDGYTSFDAAIDYVYSNINNADNQTTKKTDSLHVSTTTGHNGTGEISNCVAINDVNTSFVQRH